MNGYIPRGLAQVMANINAEVIKIKNRTNKGLILSAALVRNSTEKKPPLTPVDTGNLRASWFTVTAAQNVADPLNKSGQFKVTGERSSITKERLAKLKTDHPQVKAQAKAELAKLGAGKKLIGIMMGYTAFYAVYVHEAVDKVFHRPGSGPKWLEVHLWNNKANILEIIRQNVDVK